MGGARLRVLAFAVLLIGGLLGGTARAQVGDPVIAIAGRWQVVDTRTGEVKEDCTRPQVFAPTADRQFVNLTAEAEGEVHQVRYIVLQSQPNRALLFILGETRLTESGDPVIWWAIFSDNDHFRWRRYDWPKGATTAAEWRRCPS